jgi:uncharacterized protein
MNTQKPGLGNEALSTRHGDEAWDHRLEPVEAPSSNTQAPREDGV